MAAAQLYVFVATTAAQPGVPFYNESLPGPAWCVDVRVDSTGTEVFLAVGTWPNAVLGSSSSSNNNNSNNNNNNHSNNNNNATDGGRVSE